MPPVLTSHLRIAMKLGLYLKSWLIVFVTTHPLNRGMTKGWEHDSPTFVNKCAILALGFLWLGSQVN
jgi:hypothetical protein